MFYGTYLVGGVMALCLFLWPRETTDFLAYVGISIQLEYMNCVLQYKAWRLHRQLVKFSKEYGFPHPGPFRFVNIRERDDNS